MFTTASYRELVVLLRWTFVPQIGFFEIDCDIIHLHIKGANMFIKRKLAKSHRASKCDVKL